MAAGRIFFPGNPWPEGHPIKTFELSGYLSTYPPRLLLHLKSENYYAERDFESEGDDDWTATGVWGNFHSCTLSATHWGYDETSGFEAVAEGEKFNPLELGGRVFRADTETGPELTIEHEDLSFGLYLLGHDAAANHEADFTAAAPGMYDISWSGRIALAYIGDYELRHSFHAVINGARFSGLIVDPELVGEAQVRSALERHVTDPARFTISDDTLKRRFLPFEAG